jgi:molecular chaperone DnaK (HSP70)
MHLNGLGCTVKGGHLIADVAERAWQDERGRVALAKAAETAKIALSSSAEYTLDVPLTFQSADDKQVSKHHLRAMLTQQELQRIAEPFLKRLWAPLERLGTGYKVEFAHYPYGGHNADGCAAYDRYAAPPRRLTQLVFAGGATRAPVVRSFAERIAGMHACTGVNPEHCVALGAAVHAGLMDGSVAGGLEMTDGVYVKGLQQRVSGFQM